MKTTTATVVSLCLEALTSRQGSIELLAACKYWTTLEVLGVILDARRFHKFCQPQATHLNKYASVISQFMCHQNCLIIRHCEQLVPLKQAIWSYVTCHYNAYQNLSHRHDGIIWFWDPRHYREPCFRCNGRSIIWRKTRTLRLLQLLHKKKIIKTTHSFEWFVVIVRTSICNSSLSNSSISSCRYSRRFQRFAQQRLETNMQTTNLQKIKKTTLDQELITASKCRCIPSASLSTKGGGGRTFTGAAWAIGILGKWLTDFNFWPKKKTKQHPWLGSRAKYLGSKFHWPQNIPNQKKLPKTQKHTQLQKVLAWEVFSQTYQNVKISMFFNHKKNYASKHHSSWPAANSHLDTPKLEPSKPTDLSVPRPPLRSRAFPYLGFCGQRQRQGQQTLGWYSIENPDWFTMWYFAKPFFMA